MSNLKSTRNGFFISFIEPPESSMSKLFTVSLNLSRFERNLTIFFYQYCHRLYDVLEKEIGCHVYILDLSIRV